VLRRLTLGFLSSCLSIAVASCSSSSPTSVDQKSTPTSTSTSETTAGGTLSTSTTIPTPIETETERLLAAIDLPPGSTHISELSESVFRQPAMGPAACQPTYDKVAYFQAAGSPQAVQDYIASHLPNFLGHPASGQTGGPDETTVYFVYALPTVVSPYVAEDLGFSVAAKGTDKVGIRVDAEVAPPGATCASSGFPPTTS